MGCTEIPLGLQGSAAVAGLRLVDPARVLASALAIRAYGGARNLAAHSPL
jgi:aspartate racemase